MSQVIQLADYQGGISAAASTVGPTLRPGLFEFEYDVRDYADESLHPNGLLASRRDQGSQARLSVDRDAPQGG